MMISYAIGVLLVALFLVGSCGGIGGGLILLAPLWCGNMSSELELLSLMFVWFPSVVTRTHVRATNEEIMKMKD